MKLLVVSDIHGDYDALEQAYHAEKSVGAVLFLGDGIREAERFEATWPSARLYGARQLRFCLKCVPSGLMRL